MARLTKYIELYRFSTPISFGKIQSKEEEDGVSRSFFVSEFKLAGAPYKVVVGEQALNTGPSQEEELYYAVQEVGKVALNSLAEVNGEVYRVEEVSPGEAYNPRSYDLLKLVRGNGVEIGYRKAGA